jgi:hypothetical protein
VNKVSHIEGNWTKMAARSFMPQTLDVDESILESNLRVIEADPTETALFGGQMTPAASSSAKAKASRSLLPSDDLPSVDVTPDAGLCVKTKNVAGKKVFLNLCRVAQIPPAPPMTEEKLAKIIGEEDYNSDYRYNVSSWTLCAIMANN